MTRDEIMSMEPGRELDCLVAEKVMGYKVSFWSLHLAEDGSKEELIPNNLGDCALQVMYKDNIWQCIPSYSTDISAAWEVRQRIHDTIGGTKIISVCDDFPEECQIWDGMKYISVRANTVPEAICKAALLAVMDGE